MCSAARSRTGFFTIRGGGKFTVSMNIARELVATQEQNIFELSLYLICVTTILSFFYLAGLGGVKGRSMHIYCLNLFHDTCCKFMYLQLVFTVGSNLEYS